VIDEKHDEWKKKWKKDKGNWRGIGTIGWALIPF